MPDINKSSEIEAAAPVSAEIVKAVETGAIVKFGDLVKEIAKPAEKVGPPAKLPLPTAITEDESNALARIPEVFASVVPDEVRTLTADEVDKLLEERAIIKTVTGMLGSRLDDIALTALNHSDAAFEAGDTEGVLYGADDEPLRNKDGHVIRKQKIRGEDPAIKTHFSLEARKGSPKIDLALLEKMADDPKIDTIDHQDYLAMTTQTRVFDENKAMLLLKKRPELLRAIREATTTGLPVVSVYQRG